MTYTISTTPRFDKEFKKLDKYTQWMLAAWIDKNLKNCTNPQKRLFFDLFQKIERKNNGNKIKDLTKKLLKL